ncbi:MAG: TRAP transporter small permease [Burkholderiaceae bacterium]|nr:TRAP transporter small permease [Burkholderiaceae bacterium]
MNVNTASLPVAPAVAAISLPEIPDLAIEKIITRTTGAAVIGLIGAMVVVIWISVYTRYVSSAPISWGEQVAKYLMIWAAFLGASLGLREGAHISVNMLVDMLPAKGRKFCAACVVLLNMIFLSVCLYYGTIFSYNVRSHTDPLVWDISMSLPYAAIPVGCALMILQLLFVVRKGVDNALSKDTASLS